MTKTNWERVERVFGPIASRYLQEQTVAIIGCGSGGGKAALFLANSGVGGFILVDPGLIKEENIVRHVADSRYLGLPKAEAVAELIKYRNEEARIEILKKDIKECFEQVLRADVLLVCVDEESTKHWLNSQALKYKKVAIYAGVYEKGVGGDVMVIYPDKGPCYGCIAPRFRPIDEDAGKKDIDYGVYDKGTLRGEPGLDIDVTVIAAEQAKAALKELLKGTESTLKPLPSQLLIFNNEERKVRFLKKDEEVLVLPCSGYWLNPEKDPDCLICSRVDDTSSAQVLDELIDEEI